MFKESNNFIGTSLKRDFIKYIEAILMSGNKDSRKMKMFDYYLKYIQIYNNFENKIYFILISI